MSLKDLIDSELDVKPTRLRGGPNLSRSAPWIAVALALVIVVGILVTSSGGDPASRPGCVLVLIADRTGSSGSPELTEQRKEEALEVLSMRSKCKAVVVSAIKELPGEADTVMLPLVGSGQSWADRFETSKENLRLAEEQVSAIFEGTASRRTNFIATFEEVADQVDSLEGIDAVEVYAWWDGVNSVAPLNMRRRFLEPIDLAGEIARIQPIPACPGWKVNFLGVDRTVRGFVPSQVSRGAEAFWRAFFKACGGTLETYSPVLPPRITSSG